jgi:PAS domain S-box-containing protein
MRITTIKQRLIFIILLTTGAVLVLAIAVLITIQYISLRRSLINELTIQARIIGENSTAALSFDHPEDAKETLGALRVAPNIVYAVIFTKEGKVFAELQSNDIEDKYLPPVPQKDGYRIGINYLKVFKSIILDDETIGTLYIQSSMKKLYTPLMWYAVAAGIVIVVSLNIAFLMLSKLQQTITKPLLQLRSATTKITQGNLTARAEVLSSDELGDLTASFNVMAESLQKTNSNLIDKIADHSKAEEEIRRIFDLSIDMICIADINTNFFRKINPSFGKTLGYSDEELLAKSFIDFIHPDDKAPTLDVMVEKLSQGIPVINFENRFRCKDGSYKWLMWTSKPIPEQGITYSIARDVTDEKHADEELKKHRNQLEEMVTERTFELIDTNEQLKKEIAERKHADEQVKASLKEKEILLQEIHHRVKNNLQVIISLLRLQSRGIKDQNILTMFKESQDRINSMALVHEKIYYSKDLANIRLRDYVNDLASDLFKSYNLSSGNIEFKMEIEDIPIGIDTSIPCGLIINELLSNSLKHAFPENRKGEIKIEIRSAKESEIEMVYSDNGIGLPKSFDFKKSTGFGFRMIVDLVEYKLMGNIKLIQDGGTIFQIRFKEIKYNKRM